MQYRPIISGDFTSIQPPGQLGGRGSREAARAAKHFIEQAQVNLALDLVSQVYNVPVEELRAPTRRRAPVAFARQVAMYLSHVAFAMSLAAVGRQFGRDRTTAAYACRCIEDRRDDDKLDLLLDRLEAAIQEMAAARLYSGRGYW